MRIAAIGSVNNRPSGTVLRGVADDLATSRSDDLQQAGKEFRMWLKWLPWRYVLSRVARAHGFIDPIAVLSRLHRFAQPSEVTEPIELLRAGVIFHARGLINARTIQHNLDWVWPYWVERQFDPHDRSFVPRAFSITHINLSHRNWTAVGLPDCNQLPIVDPRGLLTPLLDGWSLDCWLIPDNGPPLYPSRATDVHQQLRLQPTLAVETQLAGPTTGQLYLTADVLDSDHHPTCRLRVEGRVPHSGWLVIALRPTNPEGVSFVHDVHYETDNTCWTIDHQGRVHFSEPPERVCMSRYEDGDVAVHLAEANPRHRITCDVGLATAAALFRLEPGISPGRDRHSPARPGGQLVRHDAAECLATYGSCARLGRRRRVALQTRNTRPARQLPV